jgi:hypothetical protein
LTELSRAAILALRSAALWATADAGSAKNMALNNEAAAINRVRSVRTSFNFSKELSFTF